MEKFNLFFMPNGEKKNIRKFFSVIMIMAIIVSFCMPVDYVEAATPTMTKIAMSRSSVSIWKGNKYKLYVKKANVKVKPKSYKWYSSNNKVVAVTNNGTIKGMSEGTAKVYCKFVWKNKKTSTVSCNVKVVNPVVLKSFKLNETEVDLKLKESFTIKPVLSPSNATITKVAYVSSNVKVATVSSKGKVYAKGKGTASIVCAIKTYDGKVYKKACKVNVNVPVTSIKLDKQEIELEVGATEEVKATVLPKNATDKTVKYSSSDIKVATVDSDGLITGVDKGTAIITAVTSNKLKATCTVNVIGEKVEPTSIELDKTDEKIYKGDTITLEAILEPEDVTEKTVTYISSDSTIATVNKDGVVEGVKAGSVTITAKTANDLTATCKITVEDKPYEISFDKENVSVKIDVSTNIKATAKAIDGSTCKVVYTSSDDKIATVDSNGQVVGKAEGTVTITATVENTTKTTDDVKEQKATCTVKVTKPDPSLKFTKEPYISTYYFNPKPSCKEEIKIPIYVTDTDQKEYLDLDDSKRFDILVEIDGKATYVRDVKPGDTTVSLGKLTEGNHYFALQSIDKDTGLKSHKLYNDLMVINPDTYAIKSSEIYTMTTADLSTYKINNANSTNADDLVNTREGLTKLFADLKSKGYRKCILLKGTYRINGEKARYNCITIPSYFTVDMNGSTFKLDTITSSNEGCIARMDDATDAHLINGTLEGDRFERKALGLERGYEGEPINTFLFQGCNNCSIENLTIKNTTGHTIGTQYRWGPGTKFSEYTKVDIVDGKEVASSDRSTSNMVDLTKIKAWSKYVSVGNGEGYRGTKGNSGIIYVHFYDKDKNYMHTVTGYQYRKIRIPEDAVYGRVTMLGELTLDHNVSFHAKHLGDYLEISNIDFIDTRTTALAPSACNNLLIENVTYTRAGNSITPCAVDFEDGWQECQDVYYRNNKVLEASGTATVIDNTGYNHVYENLEGHRMVVRRGVLGGVFRNYTDKTGYIRWTYGNKIVSKYNRLYGVKTGNITADVSEGDQTRGAEEFKIRNCEISATYIGSSYKYVTYENCTFPLFNGSNLTLKNCTVYPTSYLGDNLYFENCTFKNLEQENGDIGFSFNLLNATRVFKNCKFLGKTTMKNHNGFNSGTFEGCYFQDLNMTVGLSTADTNKSIVFNNCEINSTAQNFIHFGPFAYSRGYIKIDFNNCKMNLGEGDLIYLYAKPTGATSVNFNKCTIVKDTGKLLTGWGSISNNAEYALKLNFVGCTMNKNLDDSYKGTGNNVSVNYK